MGLNGVVSGYPTSTNLPRVDGLSTDPWDLGCHISYASFVSFSYFMTFSCVMFHIILYHLVSSCIIFFMHLYSKGVDTGDNYIYPNV